MMEMFKVIAPGPLTTVQDRGRFGFQRYGVPVSGSLDRFASRAANSLVGNPASAAVLEVTLMRLKLDVVGEADVAVCGADIPVSLNGEPRENWTSFRVEPGDQIQSQAGDTRLESLSRRDRRNRRAGSHGLSLDLCGWQAGRDGGSSSCQRR